jgi:RNA-directed DNA polymerase
MPTHWQSNQGAPGVDGQSFQGIESQGLEEWLSGVREDLRAKTYQPQAVRRVMIPKSGGGERPRGIPTIRDRVVQTAAKLLLERSLKRTSIRMPMAIGRSGARRRQSRRYTSYSVKATKMWWTPICRSISIPFHTPNLCNAWLGELSIRDMLRLIKMWLKVPVEERDENGKPRVSGGKGSTCGTPQGGVISPLLANLYMNRFLKYWRITYRTNTKPMSGENCKTPTRWRTTPMLNVLWTVCITDGSESERGAPRRRFTSMLICDSKRKH